ncbi:MAG: hypothetical protein Kow0031_02030 [Anaerolineae bacterium]
MGTFTTTKRDGFFKRAAVALLLTLATMAVFSPYAAAQAGPELTLVLLAATASPAESVAPAIQAAGGRVIHRFPGVALIATLPPEAQPVVAALPSVSATYTGPVDPSLLDPAAQPVAAVWNNLLNPSPADELTGAGHPDEHRDLLIAPDLPQPGDLSLSGSSVRPGYYDTSEFMAGSVAVGLVLLESDGSIDPSTENWTDDEKQHVFSEIVNATHWWAQLEPRANLTFVYDDHYTSPLPTGVEPINHPTFDYTGYGESKWIGDAMAALGYTATSYFTRVRDYNNALRSSYHTDWAFTIFVVDSSADSDNRFTDGYFAYAYLGGPFMVMTYGNNGYGPSNMDAVAAHEMGHIFNALDQYYAAGQSCTLKSGYLYVENQNSQYGGCNSNVASIMRGQISPYTSRALDSYAAGQVGWRDSDGDNILDPLDTGLPISLNSATVTGDSLAVSGQAEITPYPAPQQTDITINNLTAIYYRIDGQSWQQAALSGQFGDASAQFQFTLPSLPAGTHTLEVIAEDSAGNRSETAATTQFTVAGQDDGGLNTVLYLPDDLQQTGSPLTINGLATHSQPDAAIVKVEYRVNGGDWQPATPQDGVFDSTFEPFHFSLDIDLLAQAEAGLLLEARATDNTGYLEQTPASRELPLGGDGGQSYRVFLPVVLR